MDKYSQIDEMIVMIDQIFDQRGTLRATQLCDLIQRMNALKQTLREEDAHVQGTAG